MSSIIAIEVTVGWVEPRTTEDYLVYTRVPFFNDSIRVSGYSKTQQSKCCSKNALGFTHSLVILGSLMNPGNYFCIRFLQESRSTQPTRYIPLLLFGEDSVDVFKKSDICEGIFG